MLFVDGFDHYTNTVEKWTQDILAYHPLIGATGRGSPAGGALQIRAGQPGGVKKNLPANKVSLVSGVAMRMIAAPNQDSRVISFMESQTEQVAVVIRTDQRLAVVRGATVLAVGTQTLQQNSYYYIELKSVIDPAAGTAIVRLNGAVEINLAGVNTRATANSWADQVWLGGISGAGSAAADLDDFYVCDLLTAINNDFLGDVRVVALLPNGAGGNTALTTLVGAATHWQACADNPNDADVSYVASAVAGQIDTFAMADLPAGVAGTIKGIQTTIVGRKDDAGVRTIQPELRIGVTNYLVGAGHAMPATYTQLPDVIETSPATAAAFTIAEVNGLEAGVNIVA